MNPKKEIKPKIGYLCDGRVPDCAKVNCYLKGGTCKHTKDINHAVNFSWQEPERKELRVCFLCDARQACRNTAECYKNGGPCKYTFKIERAANFTSWGRGKAYSEDEPDTVAMQRKIADLEAEVQSQREFVQKIILVLKEIGATID